jgi:hypothetical protein
VTKHTYSVTTTKSPPKFMIAREICVGHWFYNHNYPDVVFYKSNYDKSIQVTNGLVRIVNNDDFSKGAIYVILQSVDLKVTVNS